MQVDLSKATVELEIRPDGSVKFHISGLPGAACEELELLLLEVLRGEVLHREHTHERYQRAQQGLGSRLKALLGQG
jgi:hypothetical protein